VGTDYYLHVKRLPHSLLLGTQTHPRSWPQVWQKHCHGAALTLWRVQCSRLLCLPSLLLTLERSSGPGTVLPTMVAPYCPSSNRDKCCFSVRYLQLPILNQVLLIHRLLDEKLPVHIAFRTPLLDGETLNSYLSRLAIHLDVFVFGAAPAAEQDSKANPPKELIYSVAIKDTEPPIILHHDKSDAAYTYVCWEVKVPLCMQAMSPNSSQNLTQISSTSRQVPQACHLSPANSIFEAGRINTKATSRG
jgi:hypothetical protein